MKAFLSHSSLDKEFVRAVAAELRRQYCVYDEKSFETGDEFRTSIERGLDESTIFVLFATKASLASLWVEFEIDATWYKMLQKQITKCLVYILDSAVQVTDVPKWLQRAKIKRAIAPKPVAREIRDYLDELIRHHQTPFFIGRTRDIERLQQIATPADGSTPPPVIVISGLPGIGRRSLVRHICRSMFNLPRAVIISIEDGDEATDVALKMADLIEPYSTQAGLQRIATEIEGSTLEMNVARIIRNLHLCIVNGDLPILLDEGGLLNEDGRFSSAIRSLLSALTPNDSISLFLVSTRRPNPGDELKPPVLTIGPLSGEESKMFISSLSNRAGMKLTPGQIAELSEYTGGFPPACSYAVQLATDYGIATVIADKQRLVEFRTTLFIKYLSNKRLQEKEFSILLILSAYSPLPLPVIGEAINSDAAELSSLLVKLIDYSLIVTDRRGFFHIAEPVRDAVVKMSRIILRQEHLKIAKAVRTYLDTTGKDDPQLDLGRVLFRAATNAREKDLAASAIHLANDIIKLTEHHYHSRDYELALKFAREAVAMRPQSFTARSFLVRSLIQEAHWSEAQDAITETRSFAPLKDVYFLEGFLERKRGRFDHAIEAFEKSLKMGRSGAALKRELASCYFIQGNTTMAAKYLDEILDENRDDRFIVDFSIQVATKQRNEKLARQRLAQLQPIDSEAFYFYRLSRVEMTFGNTQAALDAAERAVQIGDRPSYEMYCQLAICYMKSGNYARAEEIIGILETKFSRIRIGFRMHLKVMLELGMHRYTNALSILDSLPEKSDRFYLQMRKDALQGELHASAMADDRRIALRSELDQMEGKFSESDKVAIDDLVDRV